MVDLWHHNLTAQDLAELLGAESRGRPFLLYRDAARAQRVLPLGGSRLTVGRDADNELPLTWDSEVSRLHALLERLGGSWTVIDDGMSRNGTFVNGARVRGRRRLSERDVVRFGATEVLFRNPGERSDETPAAASPGVVAAVTAAQQRVLVELCRPLLETSEPVDALPSNPEIALRLTISTEAVRSQLKTLFKLLEVPDLPQNRKRAELARRALASGLVRPRDLSD